MVFEAMKLINMDSSRESISREEMSDLNPGISQTSGL